MIKKQAKKGNMGTVVAIGASIAAASAAAYLLFGPDGKKNRKVIRGWAVKMKGEIIEKLENAKEVTEPIYQNVVDQIEAKYAKAKNVDPAELATIVADIRKHWKSVAKAAQPIKKAVKKAIAKKGKK